MQVETIGGPEIWLRGPVTPSPPSHSAPSDPQQAEIGAPGGSAPSAAEGGFSWMNAHGGAGASTLAQLFGGHDSGLAWPDVAAGRPGGVLLVARTHASGLQAVSRILNAARQNEIPPGVTLSAVVLVADAPGRLPRELGRRIKVIGSVADVHRVPWVPSWRTGNLSGPLPREVAALRRLVAGN